MVIVYFNNDGTIDAEYSTVGAKKKVRQEKTTVRKVCNLVKKAAQQGLHPTSETLPDLPALSTPEHSASSQSES